MARSSEFRGELTLESQRIIAKLAKADALTDLKRAMREATAPVQPAVRQAARNIPSTHSRYNAAERGGSLRSAVANTVQRKFKFSLRNVMVVITQVPKGGKSNLARVVEGEIEWKHPTYGHGPEVVQPPHPFFYPTIERLVPGINRRIELVLLEFENKL